MKKLFMQNEIYGGKMENLIGNNVPMKKKKQRGLPKTIYFAKIDSPNFEQFGIFSNQKINLQTALERSFNSSNESFNADKGTFDCECDKQKYCIRIIEASDKYFFGEISTEREFDDLLEEYRDSSNDESIKSIIIKYFTFFYIDIEKKAIVYIGQKGLKNINKLLTKYITEYSKINISIHYLGNADLLKKIERSQKLQSIEFQIADNGGDISKSLDHTLNWDRNINSFSIYIKVKHPTKPLVKEIVQDPNRHSKVKKPILKFQDEEFNEYITHLFEDYFTVKTILTLDDIDLQKYDKIKSKLILALGNYVE